MALENMLTADEVAKVLRMTRRGVYGLIEEGRLHAVKPARRVLIAESEVRRVLGLTETAQDAGGEARGA